MFRWLFILLLVSSVANAIPNRIVNEAIRTGSDSLYVWQKGRLIYANKFGKQEQLQSVQSITKSIDALAIARLIDERKIENLDVPMSRWYPLWKSDAQKAKITLRMILTHTSGLLDDPEISKADDVIAAAQRAPVKNEPGRSFSYNNLAIDLLEQVISQSARMPTDRFVESFLFSPLGITNWRWVKDKAGHCFTAGGLLLVPSDLIKIGIVMLQNGSYNGQRIISSRAVNALTTRSQPFEDYGLLWWLRAWSPQRSFYRSFSADGWGGQYIAINREREIVGVRTRDPRSIDPTKISEQNYYQFSNWIGEWE